MHFEVEKTGCAEWLGMVQIRYCLYLDPGDHGYERHHVTVDGKERDNPFHNHFVQFHPEEATDENIKFVGELALEMAKGQWVKDEWPDVKNAPISLDHVSVDEKGRASYPTERKEAALKRVREIMGAEERKHA